MSIRARIEAWGTVGMWVAILGLLLCASTWLNVWQYGKHRAAKAECQTQMVAAARLSLEQERKRAAAADKQAGRIAQDTKHDTQGAARSAQESTNARHQNIATTRTTGACRMPDGLPRLGKAVDAANAAAGD